MILEEVLPTIRDGGYARREEWTKDLVIRKDQYGVIGVFNLENGKLVERAFNFTSFDVLADNWTCSVSEELDR